MKIIVIYDTDKDQAKAGMNILVWPDSALIRSGKPVFLPDENLKFHVGFVARMDGVGKTIKSRFAGKYYSSVAPALFFLPSRASERLHNKMHPYACDIVADFVVVCGDFIDKSELQTDSKDTVIRLENKDLESSSVIKDETSVLSFIGKRIEDSIEEASIRNTLKTGDLAGFILSDSYDAVPDSLIKIMVNNKLLIENKLK